MQSLSQFLGREMSVAVFFLHDHQLQELFFQLIESLARNLGKICWCIFFIRIFFHIALLPNTIKDFHTLTTIMYSLRLTAYASRLSD